MTMNDFILCGVYQKIGVSILPDIYQLLILIKKMILINLLINNLLALSMAENE